MPRNQSIERAAAVLRALAANGGNGNRLTDVARAVGLSKATTSRILGALVSEGFVEQDGETGLYFVGFTLFSIGNAAAERFGLASAAQPALQRLAERTGDTVYLSIRSGEEAVCIDRVEGAFPIKTLTLNVGDRRPLGVGAGSLALLAFGPDGAVDSSISANAMRYSQYSRLTTADIHELVEQARRLGYALNDQRVIPGMSAVALPVRNARGEPVAALSVAAISTRMDPERRADIVRWIARETQQLEERLRPLGSRPAESRVRQFSIAAAGGKAA